MIRLFFVYVNEIVVCKLCGQQGSNVIVQFLIQCCKLFETRDKLLDNVINILGTTNYITFSDLDETSMAKVIFGSRQYLDIEDNVWEQFMLMNSDSIAAMTKLLYERL